MWAPRNGQAGSGSSAALVHRARTSGLLTLRQLLVPPPPFPPAMPSRFRRVHPEDAPAGGDSHEGIAPAAGTLAAADEGPQGARFLAGRSLLLLPTLLVAMQTRWLLTLFLAPVGSTDTSKPQMPTRATLFDAGATAAAPRRTTSPPKKVRLARSTSKVHTCQARPVRRRLVPLATPARSNLTVSSARHGCGGGESRGDGPVLPPNHPSGR